MILLKGGVSLKRIYLIRHCKATGQEPSAELTMEGQEQAEHLANLLINLPIEYIISSPYVRAVSSIRPLAQALRMEIHTEDSLCERVLSTNDLPNWMARSMG